MIRSLDQTHPQLHLKCIILARAHPIRMDKIGDILVTFYAVGPVLRTLRVTVVRVPRITRHHEKKPYTVMKNTKLKRGEREEMESQTTPHYGKRHS